MLTTLATLAAVTLALPQQGEGRGQGQGQGSGDTTVAVQSGARLDVNNFGGEIVVHTWNQNSVRVRSSHSSRSTVDVSVSMSTVLVRTVGRRGPPSIVDLDITVPTWMGMTLAGTYTDISVENAGGPVSAESVQGDIDVSGGTGNITLKSVEGSVTLSKNKGRTEVNSVEGDITITAAAGDITVESVDGNIALMGIDAANVDVNTVDGDITYDGTIKPSGSYRLATHDGNVTVVIPPGSNVSGSVSTFEGDFDASFSVDTVRSGRHRFTFTIGKSTGAARLEVETFDGDIKLRRPGEVELERPEHNKNKHDNNDNDKDNDYDFDFHFDGSQIASAVSNAVDYAAQYAKEYAPKYARQYARTYSRKYAHTYARQYTH
jgi:DUF4097 and DUF4098 domain-containing protein YvlB